MGTKTLGVLFWKQEKIIRCILAIIWFVFVTIIASALYRIGMETNSNGELCDYNIWERGLIYQWIWEGAGPCIFSLEYYIRLSFFMLPLFFLFDYIRRKIVGFNPSVKMRIAEVSAWFAINWGYLLWLTATDYGVLNWIMGWTSFVGTLLFFVPLFLLAIGVYFLSNRQVIGVFFSIILFYLVLICYAYMQQ